MENGNPHHGTRPSPDQLRARAQASGRPTMNDPKVVEALNQAAAVERDRDDLFDLCRRQEVDIQVRDQRISYLDRELERAKREASKFESAFLTFQAQVSMMASAAQSFHHVCSEALDAAKNDLIKSGIDPSRAVGEATTAALDLGAIARNLGADHRDTEADRIEDEQIRRQDIHGVGYAAKPTP